ncbi:molybdopterin-binding protein [Pseudophaeobacter sp.]|uniref:molybdopterin-binding protein n=1 Tax=Pseudophaeobacter sp. TaxID=1971739 RepID=UPI0032989AEF
MKFGAVKTAEGEGAILAHSMQASQPPYDIGLCYRIAKGTALTAQHLADLTAEGHGQITVAWLEAGDLHEDAAALDLAQALVPDEEGQGIRISGAGAGRVNLYALGAGLVRLDCAALEALNAVDPMITIATVPDYHRVDGDGMIATIKIISYGVSAEVLARAGAAAEGALRILPPVFTSASLIETRVSREVPPDKGRRSMAGRLHRMGLSLSERVVVRHDEAELATALSAAPGEVLLILTGSATSDPLDVAPQALRRAGGSVTRFGMPVDPGNLLFLGEYQARPVIGLPGCARSPALNGADWVLERVLCGCPVSSSDIAAMGIGGLLKEIPTRPMPRRSD